ncbi:MAG: hypothetical protein ACOYW3_02385 [Bacteroidota bacterium]
MKRLLIPSLLLVLLMTACEINVIEPYPTYDIRDRVVGSYTVEEYSETYDDTYQYSILISKSGNGNDVYLENFYDAGLMVRADVVGNKIYIPWQIQDGFEVEGVGTVSGSTIRFTYQVYDRYNHTPTDYCETRMWRDW